MTSAVTLAQSASTGITTNFKNRLINGDFEIWQRGTAQTFITAGAYLADRWTCMGFQQARHQQVSVTNRVAGMTARFAMRVSSSPNSDNGSGGTRMDLSQKIENLNSYDLAGQTVTYSYWIRFSSATFSSVPNLQNSAYGNFNSYLQSSIANIDAITSTDSIGTVNGQSVITSGSLPTTWTKVTRTETIPSNANNVSLRLQMQQLGSTTNPGDNWYEVTEIQLELGSSATTMDHRPYPIELILCQRYHQRFTYPNNDYALFYAYTWNSGTRLAGGIPLVVAMRTTPTWQGLGAVTRIYGGGSASINITTVNSLSMAPGGAVVQFDGTLASAVSNSQAVVITNSSVSGSSPWGFALDAEL